MRDGLAELAHVEADSAIVESGQPLVCVGEARLGSLRLPCDGSIEGQVWGAGAALARHLLAIGLPARPEVVEIGSGTGIAGLAAAVAGASRVVLTDLPDVVPKLQRAIDSNEEAVAAADVVALPLAWGDEQAADAAVPYGADLILAADVLYSGEPSVHAALRATLVALARPRDGFVWHAYESRWPAIVELWRKGLKGSGLELVRESTLDPPPGIRDRQLVLEELRLAPDEDAIENEENDDG